MINSIFQKMPASALILAGGRGERIGGQKVFLSVDGVHIVALLIEKMSLLFNEVLLCVGKGESETVRRALSPITQFCSVIIVEDRNSGRGPIEGLYSGLNAMSSEWGFLVGCDMLSPQEAAIRYMWSRTVDSRDEYKVAAVRIDGRLMPLHAFYHRDCSYFIKSSIEQAESEQAAMRKESESSRAMERSSFNSRLRIKSFYNRAIVNVIEENEYSVIPGWRRSFEGYNTESELKSVLSGVLYR